MDNVPGRAHFVPGSWPCPHIFWGQPLVPGHSDWETWIKDMSHVSPHVPITRSTWSKKRFALTIGTIAIAFIILPFYQKMVPSMQNALALMEILIGDDAHFEQLATDPQIHNH